jgi:hypothetical protein
MSAEKFTPRESYSENYDGFQFSVVQNTDKLAITWSRAWGDSFLPAAIQNAQHLRDIEQDPTMIDHMVCRGVHKLRSADREISHLIDIRTKLRITSSLP